MNLHKGSKDLIKIKPSKMYDNTKGVFCQKIKFPEISYDKDSRIRASYIQSILQDTSSKQLASFGWDYEQLVKSGYVYLLAYLKLKIYKQAKIWEDIAVYVWPKTDKGARANRDIVLLNEKDEIIAEISTVWVLVNIETRKIVPPGNTPVDMIRVDHLPLKIGDAKKIKIPKDMVYTGERTVYYSDLDLNAHVNNSKYSDIFMDFCGVNFEKYQLEELNIDYRSEVVLGNTLKIYTHTEETEKNIKVYMEGLVLEKSSFTCLGIFKKI